MVDGSWHDGWHVDDFTLMELKTLRAIERLPAIRTGNTIYDGQFQVPTWEEIIEFVAAQSAASGRVIGLVPELKSSTYFSQSRPGAGRPFYLGHAGARIYAPRAGRDPVV